MFVNSRDASFQRFLEGLSRKCPGASLLHLDPAEAQKQMGVVSASKALVYVLLGFFIGIPLLVALIFVIFKLFGRG